MHVKTRQQAILEYLEQKGACTYTELEELLGVSGMTVRRDADKLATSGAIIKTLGGIQKPTAPASFYESPTLSRVSVHREEKRLIARMALKYIEPEETIYLDGGTTCIELAALVARHRKGLMVLTNSVLVYMELLRGNDNTIICIGGQHDPASFCLVGPATEEDAKDYFVDKAFVSTKGFLPDEGTFESSIPTLTVKQIMADRCDEVVLLVDHSKFGQRALCKVLDISQIGTVITDEKVSQDMLSLVKANVKSVYVASAKDVMADIQAL